MGYEKYEKNPLTHCRFAEMVSNAGSCTVLCNVLISETFLSNIALIGFLKKKIISGILGCLVWLTLFRRITYSSKLIAQSGHSTEKTHAFRRIQISFNSSMLFSHLCQVSSLSTKFKTKNPLDKLEQYVKINESHPISSRTCHCHFF